MKRHFGVVITLGLAAYLVLPMPGLSAPLSQRIEQKRAEVAAGQQKEGVLTSTIDGYDARISALRGDIAVLQRKQDRIQVSLDEKRAELLEVRAKLDDARERLARLRKELVIAEEALANRLVELYKADEPDAMTVILSADGFGDLLEQTEFLQRVSEQDQAIIERVRVLKVEAKKQADLLAELEQRVEDAANEILAQRNELAASKNALVASQTELVDVRDERAATLAEVRAGRIDAQEELASLEAEQARVLSSLQSAQSTGPAPTGSGQLIWPINGTLTSPFGERWGRLHAGLDIAAPGGTPIRAADSGRVVLAAWTGGYGNYTCVQHTSTLSTCYAHQSGYATSSGASVSQGQVIGYVGNTGNSFGDHVHFETRVNGSPVDPMGYL